MDPMPQTAAIEEIEETEQTEQTEEVNDFELREGMAVEVLNMENSLIFVGKVESYSRGAVVIRESRDGELPPVMYNTEVKLRFFQSNGNLVLSGKTCGSNGQVWKVDRLESRFTTEQRTFFRQRVGSNVEALCARRSSPGRPGKKAAPCQVLDVSAGGLLILGHADEYQVGDRLLVTNMHLVEQEEAFSFSCRVCRMEEREMGMARYGCQFESMGPKEQDRLLRAIFVVQREEIRSKKEREGL